MSAALCKLQAPASSESRIMKRAIQLLAVLSLATMLAACDKCGDALRPFGLPKSCTDTKPAG